MDNLNKQNNNLHIVMFPWLAFGHIMPYFNVSKSLAQKGHRVSFISTPKNTNLVKNLIPQNLTHLMNLVSIPLPQVDGLPDSAESTAELPINKVPFLKKAYDELRPAVTEFLETSHVDWIIFDFASYWLPPVASRLGVNSVCFSIFCASTMAFFGDPNGVLSGVSFKTVEDFTVVPKWINYPSRVAFKLHEMMSHFECMDSDVNDFIRFGESLKGCQIVTLRACYEFEGQALSLLEKLHAKPVVPVGLLPPQAQLSKLEDEKWESLKKWLDDKEEKSVLYVAFGSEVTLSHESMHKLAHGIEKSGLPFIWILRNRPLGDDDSGQDVIPSGFMDRVASRGVVLLRTWAPQLSILAHQSVGGFLTHCGWSSVIEGLGLGRVLVLFSGASSDQGLVARMMHERRVGYEIPRGEQDGSFTSESVAETIRLAMVEEEGEPIRANALAMRDIFGNIDLQNRYLDQFVEALESFTKHHIK